MTLLTETRERFLRAIAAKVAPDRIAEIHFFQPIKQGGVESGVAVVAEHRAEESAPADAVEEAVSDVAVEIADEIADDVAPEVADDVTDDVAADSSADAPADEALPPRFVVHTARYRYTLKGPDRGKWETNVVAEADAPLVTVEAVVRGVQRRSGDVDDPVRMDGEEVRATLDELARAAALAASTPGAPPGR